MALIPFFYSSYVIDGCNMPSTPASLLGDDSLETYPSVVDETLDPAPGGYHFDETKVDDYLKALSKKKFSFELPYAASYARCQLAYALTDALWKKGKFLLEDLSLIAKVDWQVDELGSGAALYSACESAAELASDMDIPIKDRELREGPRSISFDVLGPKPGRMIGDKLVDDPDSWIIYMPFDTDELHLGDSALSAALGLSGGMAPKMEDPDYFMDCFEVVRELVEDGILLSGVSVKRGGMVAALDSMVSPLVGAEVNISDLKRAYPSSDVVRILFSEVPGVIFQINDSDYDYLDAELLLQDVMYFPLGHPVRKKGKVGAILDSLIR